MDKIARASNKNREALFRNTANKLGMTEAIIEKDFWVCWMLDYLFNRCKWKDNLVFKGGTSLSKLYRLISRFSEDIDLMLDWRILGYGSNEPWENRSNSKQDMFNKQLNKKTDEFIIYEIIPEIKKDIENELKVSIDLYADPNNTQTVLFAYKNSFSDKSILREIRLEIGLLAEWTQTAKRKITPYSAEQYPELFSKPDTNVLTVLPERTFWEKITILHKEANRPKNKAFPSRYSRHYYDIYCMAGSYVKEKALNNIGLLEKVVKFKDKFYHCSWAKYEEAKIGTIKLMPPEHNIEKIEKDYKHMQNMIFGNVPTFEEISKSIEQLEREINQLEVTK